MNHTRLDKSFVQGDDLFDFFDDLFEKLIT